MPLIAKYRLTWRGSVVEPGTVIDALNPDEDRRLFELQRARSAVFVPEEEGNFTDQPGSPVLAEHGDHRLLDILDTAEQRSVYRDRDVFSDGRDEGDDTSSSRSHDLGRGRGQSR